GSPNRREPPAARTSPVTNGSAEPGIRRALGGEAVAGGLPTGVEALPLGLERDARRADGDLHAADRVDGHRLRGRRGGGVALPDRGGAPHGDSLGENGECDLLRRLGADPKAGRRAELSPQLRRQVERLTNGLA